ncbi:glycerol-3-phosphate transporter-like [Bactrocera neohumeralis]|uniref:glycerol-3-phosphate transporter-like n=1 Tax=Bactrocera neohumeralis TaxID=98809 RepID=UPI0021664E74|nr:glycerol-3-phosphate transporter-like [Bactrocera neohumeralis]
MSKLTEWLKVPEPAPRLPANKVKSVYNFNRYRVFLSIFIGYMGYYFVRNSTSVLSGVLEMSATEIGIITCAGFLSYGLSKFISGLISDRSNSKVFLALGLFLSGLVNLIIGVVPGIVTSVLLFTIMYLLNGWIQGMGYPPGARTLMYWYSDKERITWATLWNLSHNFGGAIAPILIGLSFAFAGDTAVSQVQAGFVVPGLVCMGMAVLVFFMQVDNPQAIGLPTIEEYKPDEVIKSKGVAEASDLSIMEISKKYIFSNTKLINYSIYSAFVYILRYGIVSWAPKFLSSSAEVGGKGLGKLASMGGFSVFEIGGIFGMLLAGYVSIKFFKNSKPLTNVMFLLVTIALLGVYWIIPPGEEYQMYNYIILVALGLAIYGPVMFCGLYSMELVPKNVAGAASGISGTFSYIFGSIVATLGMGIIVDNYGWGVTFVVLVGAAIGGIIFSLLARDKSLEFK